MRRERPMAIDEWTVSKDCLVDASTCVITKLTTLSLCVGTNVSHNVKRQVLTHRVNGVNGRVGEQQLELFNQRRRLVV